jgi:hypothetical protein
MGAGRAGKGLQGGGGRTILLAGVRDYMSLGAFLLPNGGMLCGEIEADASERHGVPPETLRRGTTTEHWWPWRRRRPIWDLGTGSLGATSAS